MMTDEEFLALDDQKAKSHALGQTPVEQLRLFALYKERHSIDLATTEVSEGSNSPLVAMGWILILVGLGVTFVAFTYDVGVSTGTSGLYGLPSEVANNDAMAVRHMIMVAAAATFVSGWIALGAGHVANAINAAKRA